MFCPKCGTSVEDGVKNCPNCGLDFSVLEQKKESTLTENKTVEAAATTGVVSEKEEKNQIVKFVFFGLAAVVLVMFFMAASNIAEGGNEIMQIQSVGGKTLEEAYYAELGTIYAGYAMISRALGIFFASVLVWLGLKK